MAAIKHISITKPCQQSWQEMTINDDGRYCNACAKTVVYFSIMSTDDIIRNLSLNHKVCGRFESRQIEQINRRLFHSGRYATGGWKRWSLVIGLLISSGYFEANAQVKVSAVQTTDNTTVKTYATEKPATTDGSFVTINGRVVDEQNESLPSASVISADGKHKTFTNSDGYYTLSVPANTDFLRVNSIGYLSKIALIDTKQRDQEAAVMKAEAMLLGEVAIIRPTLRFIRNLQTG